jgi:hypothetical protein
VPTPGPPPALPRVESRTVSLSPEGLELRQASWGAKIASGFLPLIGRASRIHTLKKEIEKKAVDARSRWENCQNNWNNYTNSRDFEELLSLLQKLRTQYDGLPEKRLRALHQLEANKYRLQLQAYLDGCRISRARIRGIGDARKATLQSYGIETAADISDHHVLAVPGFGPVALSNLKQWRNQQERRFRFDRNKGVDQAAKNVVERQILTEKIDVERKLNEGLSKLTVSSHHILSRRQTLLTQAEQAALDLAQAQADLRASSVILPIKVPGKWAIVAFAAASIGSFIIATHQTIGPATSIPQPIPPPVVSPVPPPRPTLPPHVEIDPKWQRQPEDGYEWSDINHLSVRWTLGKVSRRNPHVIASDTEGKWEPENGYDWINPDRLNDKSVRWAPGTVSNRYPNIVAGPIEGQWEPADGYVWVVNPHRPSDMRVRSIGGSQDQYTSPPPAAPFEQGLADRAEWEQWLAAQSGDFRRGADWWAGHRRLLKPGACSGPTTVMNQQFVFGCEAAKAQLTPYDIKRKSDRNYRRGWNGYAGAATPAPAPDGQAPTVDQDTSAASGDTDGDAAKRLNEQELKRLKRP